MGSGMSTVECVKAIELMNKHKIDIMYLYDKYDDDHKWNASVIFKNPYFPHRQFKNEVTVDGFGYTIKESIDDLLIRLKNKHDELKKDSENACQA